LADPKISFVLPTKDRLEWIGECLQSLLAQTVKDAEIIVINDGSTDGTKEFLDDWAAKQPNVRIVHNTTSIGAGPSRNLGAQLAKAPIIAVCDDDDCYPVERGEYILKHFDLNPDSELVNFPYVQVDYFGGVKERFDGMAFDHEAFKQNGTINYFANPTVAYKRGAVLAMGGYPKETESKTDDLQFVHKWLEAGKRIDFQPGQYMCLHRVLPNSMMVKFRGFDPKWVE
jgi:glycosyltransferase involved in cell wall biosynthesis